MHNIRVMRNLMLNSASHAFCNQPSMGGPTYWIRNIAYHLPGGAIRLTGGSAGVFFYNNTILVGDRPSSSSSNVHFRNNLILGEQSAPALFTINTLTNYSSLGLQRLPSESGRAVLVRVELAAAGNARPTTPA